MPEKNPPPSTKGFNIDWLVKGVLTRAGDAFDNFTGRKWQPSSNLATSEIMERLRKLVDSQVKDLGSRGRFVPHVIRLKVDWETFGMDAGERLERLERELAVALIDHINDCRYHTFAPIDLQVKTDYFTKGIKLSAGFDGPTDEDREIEIAPPPVTAEPAEEHSSATGVEPEIETHTVFVKFGEKETVLTIDGRERASVGRTAENTLALEHPSVSRNHASLVFNAEGVLMLADTGSTNGTFIGEEQIEYGKAVEIASGTTVKFGELDVTFEYAAEGSGE